MVGADDYCRWCGAAAHGTGPVDRGGGVGECGNARAASRLDPPRFCPTCGRRLRVQVTPTGYTASCREHGALD